MLEKEGSKSRKCMDAPDWLFLYLLSYFHLRLHFPSSTFLLLQPLCLSLSTSCNFLPATFLCGRTAFTAKMFSPA